MNRLLLALLASAVALGCKGASNGYTETPKGPALPVDHPAVPNLGLVSAAPQRMSVPQLMNTYPALLGAQLDGGAITWMIGGTPGLVLESDALGNPDFIAITNEDLSVNPLYAKFADDAARDVCNKGLTADMTRTGSARVLLPYVANSDTVSSNPTAINQNLAYLKLRFHGVKVDPSDASLGPLAALWTQGYSGNANSVLEGWRLVCVALVTAPEFHVY